jgi:hypothetical protein
VSPPGKRERSINTSNGLIQRSVNTELDVRNHLCAVQYQLQGSAETITETHTMRYFFPRELELFLEVTGFTLLSLSPTGTLDREPDGDTWIVNVVARAI